MDKKKRVELIRKGNEFYNDGNIERAAEIFEKTGYRDGLTRIGDFYFYEKRMPLIAFRYYKSANKMEKVNEIFERMIFALNKLIKEDKEEDAPPPEPIKVTLPPLKVSPKLKILAEEILRREAGEEGNESV